ncbi:hypothetical protein BH23BAC1_BH23BAC1_48810 [soil metagenome]
MTEIKEEKLFNAQVLINPNGEIQAVHRKINLTPEDEKNGIISTAKIPENVTMTDIKGIKVGIIMCRCKWFLAY